MPHKQYSKRFVDEIIGLNKLPSFRNSPEGNHIFFKFSKNGFSVNKIANFISSDTKYKKSDGFFFSGYLDLVFKHDDGIIIIDWKTNQSDKDSAAHKRQLAVYRKMYSIKKKIPEDKITTCLVYVALRGTVNTGEFGRSYHIGTRDVFKTFEGHLQTVLEWKKHPEKLIKEFLDLQEDHPLVRVFQDKLRNELK